MRHQGCQPEDEIRGTSRPGRSEISSVASKISEQTASIQGLMPSFKTELALPTDIFND